MERNKEWTKIVRDALREVEATPPADGWGRLERELGTGAALPAPVWRVYLRRIAAVAALVAGVAGGGYLWYATPEAVEGEHSVIASTEGTQQVAVESSGMLAAENSPESLQKSLVAEAVSKGVALRTTPHQRSARSGLAVVEVQGSGDDAGADSRPEPSAQSGAKQKHSGEETPRQGRSHAAARSTAVLSADEQARRLRGDDYVDDAPARRRTKTLLSVHAGGVVTGAGSAKGAVRLLMADAPNALPGDDPFVQPGYRYEYPESSFRHHQPLSFGVSVRKEFGHGLSLESGVNYTLLRSEVDLTHGTESVSQKLHLIGVPLRLNWQFLERGRFSLYIGAGGMVEKCVMAKFGTQSVAEPKVQWSVQGAAGAQYRLGGVVGLYFEPEASYYFTQTDLRTSRTDSSLSLTLRLGVRLSF